MLNLRIWNCWESSVHLFDIFWENTWKHCQISGKLWCLLVVLVIPTLLTSWIICHTIWTCAIQIPNALWHLQNSEFLHPFQAGLPVVSRKSYSGCFVDSSSMYSSCFVCILAMRLDASKRKRLKSVPAGSQQEHVKLWQIINQFLKVMARCIICQQLNHQLWMHMWQIFKLSLNIVWAVNHGI